MGRPEIAGVELVARSAGELHGRIVRLPGEPVTFALSGVRNLGQGPNRFILTRIADQAGRQVAIVRKLQVTGILTGRGKLGMMFTIEAGDVGRARHEHRLAVDVLVDRLMATRAGPIVHSKQRRLHTLMVPMARGTTGGIASLLQGMMRGALVTGLAFPIGCRRAAFPACRPCIVANRMEIDMAGRALILPSMMYARQASRRVEGSILPA